MRISPAGNKSSPLAAVSRESQRDNVNVIPDILDIDVEEGIIARFGLRG